MRTVRFSSLFTAAALILMLPVADAFAPTLQTRSSALFQKQQHETMTTTTTTSCAMFSVASSSAVSPAQRERRSKVRKEGGLFAFNTKYGALNPFGLYYGITAILLGIPWFIVLTLCQLFYKVTGGRLDTKRRLPVFFTHIWGTLLMRLTRCFPKMEGREALLEFYKENRPAMFVANHNSWMDIPFLGATIGWRNYKLISKKELGRVPILGKAIRVGGNIMVDRVDRRSQIRTLKQGIQYLKDGVHLCTYPEGTRTRTGRLMPFKNGAFKMAYKAGAPIVPISIVGADKCMPVHWMFPFRPSRGVSTVRVHPPIESTGKTESELAEQVRQAIISGLPEEQRPLEKKKKEEK